MPLVAFSNRLSSSPLLPSSPLHITCRDQLSSALLDHEELLVEHDQLAGRHDQLLQEVRADREQWQRKYVYTSLRYHHTMSLIMFLGRASLKVPRRGVTPQCSCAGTIRTDPPAKARDLGGDHSIQDPTAHTAGGAPSCSRGTEGGGQDSSQGGEQVATGGRHQGASQSSCQPGGRGRAGEGATDTRGQAPSPS